jgi:hypothetical protein
MSQATSARAPARACPQIAKRRRRAPLIDCLTAPLSRTQALGKR